MPPTSCGGLTVLMSKATKRSPSSAAISARPSPAWGGMSAGEGLALIAALEGLRFVAFDINTVSPPHDVGGMTAFLAASCLHQFLILLCKQLRLTQP